MWLLGGRDIQPTDAAAPALRIARMAVTVEIICVMVGIWQTVWAASAKRSKPRTRKAPSAIAARIYSRCSICATGSIL